MSSELFKQLSNEVDSFLQKTLQLHFQNLHKIGVEKYKLDSKSLKELFDLPLNVDQKYTKSSRKSSRKSSSSGDKPPLILDIPTIENSTKKELEQLCREYNLKVSGKKSELQDRLEKLYNGEITAGKPKKKASSKSTTKAPAESLIKNIKPETMQISVIRNKYDQLEHTVSGLILEDIKTRKVIGKRGKDGEVNENLNKDDIEQCKKYKFVYELPFNLSSDKTESEKSTQNVIDKVKKEIEKNKKKNEENEDTDETEEEEVSEEGSEEESEEEVETEEELDSEDEFTI